MSWQDADPEIPHQNVVLLSIAGPDMPQKAETHGIKVRGCFASVEEAKSHLEKLKIADSASGGLFDIYTAQVGRWLPLKLCTMEARKHGVTVEYENETLNELMKGLDENKRRAEIVYEERRQMLKTGTIPLNELRGELKILQDEEKELAERIKRVEKMVMDHPDLSTESSIKLITADTVQDDDDAME